MLPVGDLSGKSAFQVLFWGRCNTGVMELFLIRGWGSILPGCGGTLVLAEAATPAARPRPLIGRERAGGGSASGDGARKTLR